MAPWRESQKLLEEKEFKGITQSNAQE